MPCKKCESYRQMLQTSPDGTRLLQNKIDAANKALIFRPGVNQRAKGKAKRPGCFKDLH